jgi:hypothetical protein
MHFSYMTDLEMIFNFENLMNQEEQLKIKIENLNK